LGHPEVRAWIVRHAIGATMPNLNTKIMEAVPFVLPPLPEQRAIAHILGTLDDKIELNRWMNETLEGMARALFKSWFVDFDPVIDNAQAAGNPIPEEFRDRAAQRAEAAQSAASQGRPFGLPEPLAAQFPNAFHDSDLGRIPQGWRLGKIEDIAHINGWTLGSRDNIDVIDYIEISEVMRGDVGKITRYTRGEEPSRARRRLKHGDTALSTVRPDRGAYFLAVYPPESLIASTGFAVLTPKDGNWAFLHATTTQSEFGDELGRLADGGAYPAIRPDVVGNRDIVLPNDSRQIAAFDDLTQQLYLRRHQNRTESRTVAALRDTLLPKLLSGELRVNEAEKFVEAAFDGI
ncbi:MAG TPA: restriction endonuclease subunit S, partial [Candidatus Hydrogenedentes bacterium]|nr:restriction endonuclease subunit S [Candidatus Hydrogenedentota bacterium]